MNQHDYHHYTQSLLAKATANPEALGLVALGSMAGQSHLPDEWSDHDFFLIVPSGRQEAYRQNLDWLPTPEDLLWSFRETEHGLKALYRSGHVVEFAVFDHAELSLARVNDFLVLLDRGGVAEGLAATQVLERHYRPDDYYIGMLFSHLLIGYARCRRGELLSGGIFIRHYALDDLLYLVHRHMTPLNPDLPDTLDPLRRVEQAYPPIAAQLVPALDQPPMQVARDLLAIFEAHFADRLAAFPHEAVAVVKQTLNT
jgi:hypothetical protein